MCDMRHRLPLSVYIFVKLVSFRSHISISLPLILLQFRLFNTHHNQIIYMKKYERLLIFCDIGIKVS